MYSYWEKKYWKSDSDVAIVGTGLVGLYVANFLIDKYPNLNIILLDRSDPPAGASTRNAGFACFGTAGEICSDLKSQSEEEVVEMLKMRWSGLQTMLNYSNPDAFGFERKGGTEIFRTETEFEIVHGQLNYVNKLLAEATGETEVVKRLSGLPYKGFASHYYHNALEGQLNPVLLVKDLRKKALKKGVVLQANKSLKEYSKMGSKWRLEFSDDSELLTTDLILATNAFAKDLLPDLDIIPYRNQVIISKEYTKVPISGCFHLDEGYIYFRDIDNRILIGGGRHFDKGSECTKEFGENKNIIDRLTQTIKSELGIPHFEVDYTWSGIIATGTSKKPIIRRQADGSIIGVRSGGMGVAISSEIANEVVELIG